jgi:hypothetical protein
MSEYHKIQTLYLRDPENNHRTLLDGQWALPEFGYLSEARWVFTEKVDGTNIRVIWDGERVSFGGKTDNAQIPTPLLDHLLHTFPAEQLAEALKGPLILYGEGYGPKIQKGGRYRDDAGFVLFDALAGDVWLERWTIEEVAGALSIPIAPIVGEGRPVDAVGMCRAGFKSVLAEDPTLDSEGIVLRPAVELRDRRGKRVIAKLKLRDFR